TQHARAGGTDRRCPHGAAQRPGTGARGPAGRGAGGRWAGAESAGPGRRLHDLFRPGGGGRPSGAWQRSPSGAGYRAGSRDSGSRLLRCQPGPVHPKTVETASERQKLMFRVRAQIPPALLERYLEQVKTGVPGVAWLKLDADAPWPPELAVSDQLLKLLADE